MRLIKEITIAAALTLASIYSMGIGNAHEATIGNLVIGQPWSRETGPTADVSAGFMSITNNGAEDDKLIKATADISDTAQLHDMKMENDVMTMLEMKDGIVIPAGATVEFKPKSFHIMFLNIKTHPKSGDAFKGTLTFEKAGAVDVEFAVKAADEGMQ